MKRFQIGIALGNLKYFRSSERRCPVEKGILKYLAKFTGEQLYLSLFLIKLQAKT